VILVAAITTRKTDKIYPFEALIEPPEGGLPQRSKVLLMQLRALDTRRTMGKYGDLGEQTLERVDSALRIAVGLTRL